MKHPAVIGLAAGLALALTGVFAYRHLPPPAAGTQALEQVQLVQVWDSVLPDLDGNRQAIRQWQGKVLIVNFWAPWCPPCRDEIPGFIRLQGTYGPQGLQFVGVALDDPDKVRAFAEETGMNYPVLLGELEAAALSRAAGNRLGGLPYTLVLDRQGNPAATLTGGLDEARVEGLIKPLL